MDEYALTMGMMDDTEVVRVTLERSWAGVKEMHKCGEQAEYRSGN